MGLILQDCMYLLNNLNGCAITFANEALVVVSLSDLVEWSCTPPFLSDAICIDLF